MHSREWVWSRDSIFFSRAFRFLDYHPNSKMVYPMKCCLPMTKTIFFVKRWNKRISDCNSIKPLKSRLTPWCCRSTRGLKWVGSWPPSLSRFGSIPLAFSSNTSVNITQTRYKLITSLIYWGHGCPQNSFFSVVVKRLFKIFYSQNLHNMSCFVLYMLFHKCWTPRTGNCIVLP